MITKLGKELRKLRLDLGITLFEMAKTIQISSGQLSSYETGRKPATEALLGKLAAAYDEVRLNQAKYRALIEETKKEVTINLGTSNAPKAKEFAMAFARSFDTLSESDFENLLAVFNKSKSKG